MHYGQLENSEYCSFLILKSRNQYYMYDFVTKHYRNDDSNDNGNTTNERLRRKNNRAARAPRSLV